MENNQQLRRFPLEDNFMKGNKEISKSKPSDMLYGYLQMMSNYRQEDDVRFVYKKNYSHSDVEKHFGYDTDGKAIFPRKNVERAFKVLIQYGYVREIKVVGLKYNYVSAYELPYNVDNLFQYINMDTLRFLLNTCNPNVIKLYIFFKYKFHCFRNEFVFTQKMLLVECFGLTSDRNKKSVDELKDRMSILKKLGLIDWCEFTITNTNGIPVPQKRLLFVNNCITEERVA